MASKFDVTDPANHCKPLWLVYGDPCFPRLLCCELQAYDRFYQLQPPGRAGVSVAIWGYGGRPGLWTRGIDVDEFLKPHYMVEFFTDHEAAISKIRKLTTRKLEPTGARARARMVQRR